MEKTYLAMLRTSGRESDVSSYGDEHPPHLVYLVSLLFLILRVLRH